MEPVLLRRISSRLVRSSDSFVPLKDLIAIAFKIA
jgi:hypothetical protein